MKPQIVHEQKVDSTNLAHVAYIPALQLLQITFQNGAIYRYSKVPKKIYDGLIRANSKGSYFNQNIKQSYSHRLVKTPKKTAKAHEGMPRLYLGDA